MNKEEVILTVTRTKGDDSEFRVNGAVVSIRRGEWRCLKCQRDGCYHCEAVEAALELEER